jgi:XTP/dITP diphosphohydrolase
MDQQTTLLFATYNSNKVEEMRTILGERHPVISLSEAGISQELEEPYDTLEENARAKCATVFSLTGRSCFSEDTGLFTEALGGKPGVHSARYAGDKAGAQENMEKLLHELSESQNRKAEFRTVICLIIGSREYFFEGICKGSIIHKSRGSKGFGYDPVFVPEGSEKTFAEMTREEKSGFSHRKKALAKLIAFLEKFPAP